MQQQLQKYSQLLPQLFEQEVWSILAHSSSWNLSYTRSRKARTALFVLPKQTEVIRFHEPYLIRKSQLNPGRSHKTDTTQVFCGLMILEQSTVFGRLDANCSNGAPERNHLSTRHDATELFAKAQSKPNQHEKMLLFSNAQHSIIISRSYAFINEVLEAFHQHQCTYSTISHFTKASEITKH